MLSQANTASVIVAGSSWVSIGAMLGIAAPRKPAPKPQDNLALGAYEVKRLPFRTDTGKNVRISEKSIDILDAVAMADNHPGPVWLRGKPFLFLLELLLSLTVLSTVSAVFYGLLQLLRRML
ncbi:MAG: hypothetical protein ACLQU1_37390 [Bryobacteraceae bacterium]